MGIDREISAFRRGGIGRYAVTLLLLLAFAFQSYLTQTHIHGTFGTPAQICVSKCIVQIPPQHSPPGEASNCLLCQAIVHAGAFFAPPILAVVVPRLWVENLASIKPYFAPRNVSVRNGLSRAPPLR